MGGDERDALAREAPTKELQPRSAGGAHKLVAIWNGGSVSRDLPASGALVIGRGEGSDVIVDHASVSRRHAILHVSAGGVAIEDLGSSNGTWVAGRRLDRGGRAPIQPGALLEVGGVLLVVRAAAAAGTPLASAPQGSGGGSVVVVDPAMLGVYELVDVVAKSGISVVVLGETGVGKEVVAARIHASSPRAARPFVRLNCAALPEQLLEAELFGYERGAFTGAVAQKQGLIEAADGGTLFLDEVGELPLSTQAKLLRALESGEVTRVGAVKPRTIDVRFVAATNRDLRELVAQGRFRQDLFFRLDGISIAIPALRDRPRDVPALAAAFVAEAAANARRRPPAIHPEALARLSRHAWLGNVRELKNVMTRSVLLCPGDVLGPENVLFESAMTPSEGEGGGAIPGVPPPPPTMPPLPGTRADERQRILAALDQCAGNQTRAAKLLGISRRTLVTKLDLLGVPRPRK